MAASEGPAEREEGLGVSYVRNPALPYDLAVLDVFPERPIVVEKGACLDAAMLAEIGHVLALLQSLLAQRSVRQEEDLAAGS